jgi:2,5-diketo-D-gluconate reductase A
VTAHATTRTLNSGYEIPLLGLGTYPLNGSAGADAMAHAISIGYRLLDTAAKYENEAAVGEAVRRSGVDRRDLFITTKLRGADHGRDKTKAAVATSLALLQVDYLDLYLIHWPLPRLGLFLESYEAMLELAAEGLIRSVGVSNFKPAHIKTLIDATGVTPAVDQIELSPALPRRPAVDYLESVGIVPQAWSPLGHDHGITTAPGVMAIAAAHGVTPAQVALRWEVQQGIVAIPKSADPGRQLSNLDVFSFSLSNAEIAVLDTFDRGEQLAVDSDEHEEF